MSHGFELPQTASPVVPANPAVAMLVRALGWYNRVAVFLSMLALMLTSLILTYSVVARYFFHAPTEWQDEVSVFMLVGMIFLCSAHVQALRGHIGIEALAGYLSPRANQLRLLVVDVLSLLFCCFFAWKSWTLLMEAWVDDQTTSSTFGAPLWIPYSMMALGMSVLSLQLLAQVLTRLTGSLALDNAGQPGERA